MQITQLFIYPIKSAAGLSLTEADLSDRGLIHDRRWMLIDPAGRFVSQRELPEMALLDVALLPDALRVSHRSRPVPPLLVPLQPTRAERLPVNVWGDVITAQRVDFWADSWFTETLNAPLRLVFLPDDSLRPVDETYALPEAVNQVSFADGYPFLLAGQASLAALNGHLTDPVPMNRFRPNLVFSGGEAWEEDTWGEIRIGDFSFFCVKPCARCPIPGIDQATGQRSSEVLRVLNTYRRRGQKVLFGQNLLATTATGRLRVGDRLEVISLRIDV